MAMNANSQKAGKKPKNPTDPVPDRTDLPQQAAVADDAPETTTADAKTLRSDNPNYFAATNERVAEGAKKRQVGRTARLNTTLTPEVRAAFDEASALWREANATPDQRRKTDADFANWLLLDACRKVIAKHKPAKT